MDLLTYLREYEPQELVRISRREYTTRTHDSLKISNGLWMWWSHGIGGKTALEYLIRVRGLPFTDAVLTVLQHPRCPSRPVENEFVSEAKRSFVLPRRAENNDVAIRYLTSRGIAHEVINFCIENGLLYESKRGHNVVFIGYDDTGMPRYAGMRSTGNNEFKGDAEGSDKSFAFRLVNKESTELHVFEGPVDFLSYATLMQRENKDWRQTNLLSLAGVCKKPSQKSAAKLPPPLERFLQTNQQIQTIHLHLDRDAAGRNAAEMLSRLLSERYSVIDNPPPHGKDINEYLCRILNLSNRVLNEGRNAG